jgi:HAD superfamily hydrolase (TIGR01509 family)
MNIRFPTEDYEGYIFDLDGTLIHSMPVHYRAWDQAMRAAGIGETLSEELFYSLGGMPTPLVAVKLGEHYGITVDGEEVAGKKEELYMELMPTVELIEPVVAFARQVARSRPVAIATGGGPEVAGPTVEALGLGDLFNIIVTPADVAPGRGKPAPDMFLEAARRIDAAPEHCVVFEDAVPGMEGARAAGMAVVEVPSRFFPRGD